MNRRHFLGTTTAGLLASFAPNQFVSGAPFNLEGVKIGTITYSYRSLPGSAQELLGYLKQAGMDTVELMGGPAEAYAGGPTRPPFGRRRGRNVSEEELAKIRAQFKAYNEEARAWREGASFEKFEELGRMYKAEGIDIDILKLGDPSWSDKEIDYAFMAAKAMGARGISFEISNVGAERVAPFADKHEMYVGLHNHTQVGDEGFSFDVPLSYSKYIMLNLDIGHYVAGTNESPIPVIKKYHDRITHLHLKDRKKDNGENVPWGEGDTPIVEVLQLLKKEQYPITAMIELEYEVPEGSDVLTEMAKCVEYCRKALA